MRNRTRCYIRYSDHKQDDGFSIEYQLREINEFVAKNNLDLQKVHIDQAMTATKVAGRDEFFALVQAVKDGLVDTIVVYKTNRIFRNALESHKYRALFQKHNVVLMSVTQHIDETTSEGRFMTSTLANVDQYQSEIISDHVKSSMREMARQGYYTGGRVLYGYNLQSFENGGRLRKKYAPNENEAQIVKYIFELFASGITPVGIMQQLKAENIKNRNGKYFFEQVIVQMLKNDSYIGTVRYRVKGYDEIITPNAHEAIIDLSLWNTVQRKLQERNKVAPRKKLYSYALTGKIYCGLCGTHFFGCSSSAIRGKKRYVYHNYVCQKKRTLRDCENPQITKEKIENIVLQAIKKEILNDSQIDKLTAQIMAVMETTPTDTNIKIKEIKSRKKEVEKQINMLIDMRLNGELSGEIIKRRSAPLESELVKLENDLFFLEEQQNQTITAEQVQSFLRGMLENADNCNEATLKSLFDCFVKKITVSTDRIDIDLRVFPTELLAYKDNFATPNISLYAHMSR